MMYRNIKACGGLVTYVENWTWHGDLHAEGNPSGLAHMALPALLPEFSVQISEFSCHYAVVWGGLTFFS
jgi:hypothetical protein